MLRRNSFINGLLVLFGFVSFLYADVEVFVNDGKNKVVLSGSNHKELIANWLNSNYFNSSSDINSNRVVFKIKSDKLDKLADDIKENSIITKGTDSAISTNTGIVNENMFLKAFSSQSVDSSGILISKLYAYEGGKSKAYILRSGLKVDSDSQGLYKYYEFFRVNFLDDFAELFADYYLKYNDVPLFIAGSNKYINEYIKLASGLPSDDLYNKLHDKLLSLKDNVPNIDFGTFVLYDKKELDKFKNNRDLILTDVKKRLSDIKGTATSSMFSNKGFEINYGVNSLDSVNDFSIDPNLMISTHASFISTIMTKYNIRQGIMIVSGAPAYEIYPKSNITSPVSYRVGYNQWKEKHKRRPWRNKMHYEHWVGYGAEADQIFTIQANDYINFNSVDYSKLINQNIYESMTALPSVLPFGSSIGSPSISHQNHIFSHIASFVGYGTMNGGGNYNTGVLGDYAKFANYPGGEPIGNMVSKRCCGTGVWGGYAEKVVKLGFNWVAFLVTVAFVVATGSLFALTALQLVGLGTISSIGLFHLFIEHKKYDINSFLSDSSNSYPTLELKLLDSKVDKTLDADLAKYLDHSSIYNDIFSKDNKKDKSVFNPIYSRYIVSNSKSNSLSNLRGNGTNLSSYLHSNVSKMGEYFGYASSNAYGSDNPKNFFLNSYHNDNNMKNYFISYLKGN